jgi:carbonic anhydrase/acetyltransferase-like protein (isoleucine patch superfamily)
MIMIRELKEYKTNIAEDAVVMETGLVIGDVELKSKANIWFGAVLRGDRDKIVIGEYSNIQDNCVVHTSMGHPTVVGDNCVVGHAVNLHGCKIGDNCLIGIGAILLDGCEIGENSIVAAGTLIPGGKKIPPNSMVMGNPYKIKRKISEEEVKQTIKHSRYYYDVVANIYK